MKKFIALLLLISFTKITAAQTTKIMTGQDSIYVADSIAATYARMINDSLELAVKQAFAMDASLPLAIGFVNDFEDILDQASETAITGIILTHQTKTTNQVSVITVKGFSPFENINDYSYALFNKWGIGQAGKNNGVLITVSKVSRRIRISTGYGVEDKLTEAIGNHIINDIMIPEFKKENYKAGILKGVEEIIRVLEK